jgi:hypothetical protein
MRPVIACAVAILAVAASDRSAAATLSLQVRDLNGRSLSIPSGLPADRTLLLVGFRHSDRTALDDWRKGLGLSASDPAWLETPIIGVGSGLIRGMILEGMRRGADTPEARAHLAPAFVNAKDVAAALGLDPSRPAAVVIDRAGRVLASAGGDYDPARAHALLAALR